MNNPALVIAIHGTRSAEGQAVGRALTQRVAAMLSDVDVRDAYVELDTPTIADALASALETQPDRRAVVVPLMLGQGRLTALWFLRARARRVENGAARRVDLTFRARIDLG